MTLFKQKGSRADWGNWRPIALLPIFRKIFEGTIAQFITRDGFHVAQGGFQPSKSTLDQVASLNHACHIAKRKKKPVYMVFLDIWAAFDTVDRNLLYDKLKNRVPTTILRIIEQLLSHSNATIIADGKQSRTFPLKAGVPQGSTISPFLYNVLINELFHELQQANIDILVNGSLIKTDNLEAIFQLGFADDIALITTDPEAMQKALNICMDYSIRTNFRWKPSKCVSISSDEDAQFTIYGEPIQTAEVFNYLGIPFRHTGIDSKLLVEQNIAKATKASFYMQKLGVNGFGFQPYRCVLAWKSYVRSCLEYGIAVTPLDSHDLKRLDRCQRDTLRKIFSSGSNSSLDVMLRLADADSYQFRAKELQARWIKRALHANELNSMVKRWLLDAINDMSSPFRQLMKNNKVWDLMYDQSNLAGTPLESLWTQRRTSRGSVLRQNQFIGYDTNDPFSEAKYVKQPSDIKDAVRKQWWQDHYRKLQESDSGILVRDIPPSKGSPLKHLTLSKEQRRQLLCWWLGVLPGHKRNQYCYICRTIMEPSNRRAHASRCITALGIQLPSAELVNSISTGNEAQAPLWKASTDGITNAIWLMYSHKDWDPGEGWAALVFQALEAVVTNCLRYTF